MLAPSVARVFLPLLLPSRAMQSARFNQRQIRKNRRRAHAADKRHAFA